MTLWSGREDGTRPWRIAAAVPSDLGAYLDLLAGAGLPPDGLAGCLATALVARTGEALVGAVALELYDTHALLRSLVVDVGERGSGIGRTLVGAALALAHRHRVSEVLLLTETAAPFFARLGFTGISRADVPSSVRASVQFRTVCPASAIVMRIALPGRDVVSPASTEAPTHSVQPSGAS
jgi:amino-acid N-acetyltransferase